MNAAPTLGKFIAFEGGEGTGKSSQINKLSDFLTKRGIACITTREPGGTPGAEIIRELLVAGDPGRWDGVSELLLVYAARRDHVERLIKPALARGTWVLSDRFAASSLVYQGAMAGVGEARVRALHHLALGDFWPDLSLVFDLDVDAALGRATARDGGAAGRYERMGRDFHQRVRQGYLDLALTGGSYAVVDAGLDPGALAAAIAALVEQRLL